MKKITIIAIIFMAISGAYAQTSLNPKTVLGVDISTTASSTLSSSTFNREFGNNHFLLGWNWGDFGRNILT